MSVKLEEICTILDRLTLDALTLMEEHIQTKLEIENSMNEGEVHLAKSRYIMGHNKVSELQLPTEDSPEFEALATIHPHDDEKLFNRESYDLEMRQKGSADNLKDPLKWFGILLPKNLHQAQSKFKQSLLWSVKCVNLQTQLNETCIKIKQLYELKEQLGNVEE